MPKQRPNSTSSAQRTRHAVTPQRFGTRPLQKLFALLMLMTLVATACGGSANNVQSAIDSAADSGDAATYAADDADYEFEESAAVTANSLIDSASEGQRVADAAVSGSAGGEAVAQLPDLGRDIIYTATLELASTDVSTATRAAIRAVEARGGFLFAQETSGGAGGSSVLTFKVLPEQFQAVLNDLGSVGNVRSQSISADDVSAIVVDLESRINTSEASVIRLRNLLDEASELETIATLENQLLQRETTLEQLRGQLRTVQNQVDLATITVFVTELLNRPGIGIEVMTFAGHDAGFSCFDTSSARAGETGDPLTTCYRLTNTGDAPLVDITFDDPSLGATIGSMVLVDGSITQIDPGETVVLAHEFELEANVKLRTSVTATGLDQDGNPLPDEVKATAGTVRFEVTDLDDGFPSFGEVLSKSWNALVTAAIVFALIAVAVAPFLAVGLVLGFIGIKAYRQFRKTRPVTVRPPQPAPPAPAPPVAPTAPAAPTSDADAEEVDDEVEAGV